MNKMGSKKTLTLVDENTNISEYELLCAFESDKFNSKYIIYTKNEHDDNNNTIIYAGKIKMISNKEFLVNIDSDIEWAEVKRVMREMANYSDNLESSELND